MQLFDTLCLKAHFKKHSADGLIDFCRPSCIPQAFRPKTLTREDGDKERQRHTPEWLCC